MARQMNIRLVTMQTITTDKQTYLWALTNSMAIMQGGYVLEIPLDEVCNTLCDVYANDGENWDITEQWLDGWYTDVSFAMLRCDVTF